MKNRCSQCGQFIGKRVHVCGSVDLKGDRFCIDCGRKLSNVGYERWKSRCRFCEKKRWRMKDRFIRIELKKIFGGECNRCGYGKVLSVLHFHHVDGRMDGQERGAVKMKEIVEHPERFELLCPNCHAEEHHWQFNQRIELPEDLLKSAESVLQRLKRRQGTLL